MWNFFNQIIFKLVKTALKHKLRLLSLREIIWFKVRLFWFHWWLLFFFLYHHWCFLKALLSLPDAYCFPPTAHYSQNFARIRACATSPLETKSSDTSWPDWYFLSVEKKKRKSKISSAGRVLQAGDSSCWTAVGALAYWNSRARSGAGLCV